MVSACWTERRWSGTQAPDEIRPAEPGIQGRRSVEPQWLALHKFGREEVWLTGVNVAVLQLRVCTYARGFRKALLLVSIQAHLSCSNCRPFEVCS
jgi:hypothetical protein